MMKNYLNRTPNTPFFATLLLACFLGIASNAFAYSNPNISEEVLAADVDLILTVDNPTPNIGELVTFTVTVHNEGPKDATNIEVASLVMNGYTNIQNISGGGNLDGDLITWDIPLLADNGTTSFTYQVEVLAPTEGINYDNLAEVISMTEYDRDSTPGNGVDPDGDGLIGSQDDNPNDGSVDEDDEDDADNEPVTPRVIDLELIKTIDNQRPSIGETVTYTITVENKGTTEATGVVVKDTSPDGLTNIDNIDNGGSIISNDVVWFNLSVPAGGAIVLTYNAVVALSPTGNYTNIAEIVDADQFDIDSTPDNGADTDGDGDIGPLDDDDSQDPDDEDDGDDESFDPIVADIELIKTVSEAYPNVGDVISFSITINNTGDEDLTNIEVTDIVPNGYFNIDNISNGGIYAEPLLTWDVALLEVGNSMTLTFDASVAIPGADIDYVNIAEVTAMDQTDIDSNPGNGADTDGDGDIGSTDDDDSQDPDDEDDGDDASVSPCFMSVTIAGSNFICFNDCTMLTANVIGGTAPFTYEWNDMSTAPTLEACGVNGISYSVIVTDVNGCTTEGSFTLDVICINGPEFIKSDPDDQYQCGDTPVFGTPEATGECEIISLTFEDVTDNNGCLDNITRVWTATDECGNTATVSQTMVAFDLDAPTFIDMPEDVIYECLANVPTAEILIVSDNCDPNPIVTVEDAPLVDCVNDVLLRIWTATDCEGNSAQYIQNITILDSAGPVFDSTPGDIDAPCGEIPDPEVLTATDNCGSEVTVSMTENETSDDCQSSYIIERVWTATDCVGNTTTHSQLINLSDNTAPVISGLGDDGTFECGETPQFDVPTATDDCGEVTLEFIDNNIPNSCGGNDIERVWTATDECGNAVSASQLMSEVDLSSPIFGAYTGSGTYQCGAVAEFDEPTVSDNCSEVTLTFSDATSGTSCAGDDITRTWIATDQCGNTSEFSHTVVAEDNEAPTLENELADGEFNCTTGAVFTEPEFADNCSEVSSSFVDAFFESGCAGQGVTRTWTATDACGNTLDVSQTLTPVDTEAPVFDAEYPDGTFNCQEAPGFADASATDDCGTVTITHEDIIGNVNCANSAVTRIWTATDECGNSSTTSQTFEPLDDENPIIENVGANGTYNCNEGPVFSEPEASDNCTAVTLSFEDVDFDNGCSDMGVTRIWTATDGCGNTSSASQTMNAIDDTPPVINVINENGTYECDTTPVFEDPEVSDDCSEVTLSFSDTPNTDGCYGEGVTRVWTATDACGNASTATQSLTQEDLTPPVINNVGDDGFYNCSESPVFSEPVVEDNCSGATLEHSDANAPDSCAGASIIRTWIATDGCGNTATASQTMTAEDNEGPIFVGDYTDGNYECGTTPNFVEAEANDDCGEVNITFEDTTGTGGCDAASITRTWTATDDCGNSSTVSQTMSLLDDVAPTILGIGDDGSYACGLTPMFSVPTTEDNCSMVTLTFEDVPYTESCTKNGTTRIWTATDECGNTSTASQTMQEIDVEAPVFTSDPQNGTYECGNTPEFELPEVTDNCTEVSLSFEDTIDSDDCEGNGVTRTWTATDECGNVATISQSLTILDNDPPVFSDVGMDGTYNCVDGPVFSEPTVNDACSTFTLTFEDSDGPESCMGASTVRTWTATDLCGNVSTASQTMSPIDTESPVFESIEEYKTFDCGTEPVFDTPVVSDDCGEVTLTCVQTPGSRTCSQGISTKTWTATDACGNTAVIIQTLESIDVTPPVIEGVGADGTFECPDKAVFSEPTATDECSSVSLEFVDIAADISCAGEGVTRIWTATDGCGNESTASQTMLAVDNSNPVFVDFEETVLYPCSETLEIVEPTVEDNCSVVTLTHTSVEIPGDCYGVGTEVSWTATDECGNVTTAIQSYYPDGSSGPVILDVADDGTYDCEGTPVFSEPSVSNNCVETTLTFEDIASPGGCSGPGTTRVWTATDICGNSSTASQTMDPLDSTSPTIEYTGSGETTFECGEAPVFCESHSSSVNFNLENCLSNTSTGSGFDYSEFTGQINNHPDGVQITVATGNIYRDDATENGHSCTPGHDGGTGMCVDILEDCVYDAGSTKSIIIELNVVSNGTANFNGFSFYENAPLMYNFVNGPSGDNNYPTLYGVRILKNGVEIFSQTNNPTSDGWNLESFDFSGNTDFEFNESAHFQIELLAYCAVGNSSIFHVWDVDDLSFDFSTSGVDDCLETSDNCSSVTMSYEDTDGSVSCAGLGIVRTWTATDECGNTSTFVQTFEMIDLTGPSIEGVGANGTYECGETAVFSEPTTVDECSMASLSSEDVVDGNTTTRTWTATDECGNTSTASQEMTEVNCFTDLELVQTISNSKPVISQIVSFDITVSNMSMIKSTGVEVMNHLPSGFTYDNYTVTQGTYDHVNGMWYLGELQGQSNATMTLYAYVNPTGEYYNMAEVYYADQPDVDSTPGNGIDTDGDGDIFGDSDDEDDAYAVKANPNTLSLGFSMYPNPVQNILTIDVDSRNESQLSYKLLKIDGQKVLEEKYANISESNFNSFKLDVSGINPGAYILEVKIGNHRFTEKLMILR